MLTKEQLEEAKIQIAKDAKDAKNAEVRTNKTNATTDNVVDLNAFRAFGGQPIHLHLNDPAQFMASSDKTVVDPTVKKAEERASHAETKLSDAAKGELKWRAEKAGLQDMDLLSLDLFKLPENVSPGDAVIKETIEKAVEAKKNWFTEADQKNQGRGEKMPGKANADSAKKDEVPKEWNLYGSGLDAREGFRIEEGTAVFDYGLIVAAATQQGVDLRKVSKASPRDINSIF